MPAYRSQAEADIRGPVVDRLREILPGCRIIHEINAASFGNRIDVMAIGDDDLVTVEIKSAKDKLDRLPAQLEAMKGVSNRVVVALHEKFLIPARNEGLSPPDGLSAAITWVYPQAERKGWDQVGPVWHSRLPWRKRPLTLPPGALGLLWREELHAICRSLGLSGVSKLTMDEATDLIRWHMTGGETTRVICATLRARKCPEADPPTLPGVQ